MENDDNQMPELSKNDEGMPINVKRGFFGYSEGMGVDARTSKEGDKTVITYLSSSRMALAEKRVKELSFEEVQCVIEDFSVLYYNNASLPEGGCIHATQTWRGVSVAKMPTDVWAYQEIIMSSRPDVIIETGVDQGGSMLILSDFVALEDLDTHIIGVDIDLSVVNKKVIDVLERRGNYTLFQGSSTNPKLIETLTKFCAGKKVMVILDSSHTYQHVKDELAVYPDLVPLGSHLIIEDTLSTYGAERATNEFLNGNVEFSVDQFALRFMLTQSVNSILTRTANKGHFNEVSIGG